MILLEWSGALLTLAGVWLTAKGNRLGWLAGSAGSLVYILVCILARLYAESALQAVYAIMGFYGWILWKQSKNQTITVKQMHPLAFTVMLFCWLILMLFFGFILSSFSDTDLPYTDAAIAAAGLLLTWQMAKRFIECWPGWIIANVLSMAVFLYKTLYTTAALYFLLAIFALYGYRSWKSLFESQ